MQGLNKPLVLAVRRWRLLLSHWGCTEILTSCLDQVFATWVPQGCLNHRLSSSISVQSRPLFKISVLHLLCCQIVSFIFLFQLFVNPVCAQSRWGNVLQGLRRKISLTHHFNCSAEILMSAVLYFLSLQWMSSSSAVNANIKTHKMRRLLFILFC